MFIPQDTIKPNHIQLTDSSLKHGDTTKADSFVIVNEVRKLQPEKHLTASTNLSLIDTTAVCRRNSIEDVTFYDPDSFLKNLEVPSSNNFLVTLAKKNKVREEAQKTILVNRLKDGDSIPVNPMSHDWMIIGLIMAAFLFSIIRSGSNTLRPSLKFFHFHGMNDMASHDTGGLFHWQSTLLNFISFVIISIFIYLVATFNNLDIPRLNPLASTAVALGIIIISFTLRHIICLITGFLSGQTEAFREYLIAVHQSYRLSAIVLFAIVVLVSYTSILPAGTLLKTGLAAVGFMYLLRVTRLFIIFIKRNISIFYLILYLCALEILPVLIITRYFKGL